MQSAHWGLLGLIVLIAYIIAVQYWPNLSGSNISVALSKLDIYKTLMKLSPIACMDGSGSKLCDYYIASAFRPTYPSKRLIDWMSADAIPRILKAGARWLELEVVSEKGRPVVTHLNGAKFRQTLNVIYLEDALKQIEANAWNAAVVPNSGDPLILSVLIQGEDTALINDTAYILKTNLQTRMLESKYSFQRLNLAQEPICNLRNKVIIVSGGNHRNTDMDELVNLSWSGPHLRRLTLTQAEETYDHNELTNFNRQNITMVIPDENLTQNENKGFQLGWAFGCQAVFAFYQSQDDAMEDYVEKFQMGSFILKPEGLRFSIPTYPTPKAQIEQKKSTPIQVKTAIYTATI